MHPPVHHARMIHHRAQRSKVTHIICRLNEHSHCHIGHKVCHKVCSRSECCCMCGMVYVHYVVCWYVLWYSYTVCDVLYPFLWSICNNNIHKDNIHKNTRTSRSYLAVYPPVTSMSISTALRSVFITVQEKSRERVGVFGYPGSIPVEACLVAASAAEKCC